MDFLLGVFLTATLGIVLCGITTYRSCDQGLFWRRHEALRVPTVGLFLVMLISAICLFFIKWEQIAIQ
jgi:hypothetical protein